ncbi:MAG: hypothetical protein KatS3mg053_1281 [Candidatus Roseilinea sp.]|nr:MAG: hypothetical protein KatS3mg053_1281 [Candidatus Roseilinea sp.]
MFIPLLLLLVLALIAMAILVRLIVPFVAIARRFQSERPPAKMPEAQYADDARRLVDEIKAALKTCPLPYEQKTALLRQVRDVPNNVTRALCKLNRLRRIAKIAKRSEEAAHAAGVLDDIKAMERCIVDELRRTHETLLTVPVVLMKVDVARGERNLDRIIAELSETNRRLNDLADSYGEVRAEQNLSYP